MHSVDGGERFGLERCKHAAERACGPAGRGIGGRAIAPELIQGMLS
jgi:hypothetical protein